MTPTADDLPAAAVALATLLEAENRLLAALDLAGATTLLAAKQDATSAFLRAQGAMGASGAPPAMRATLTVLGSRLRTLAAENRRLLECGLMAQGRVIAVIGRAARAHAAKVPHYGASGTLAAPRTPAALAICARV